MKQREKLSRQLHDDWEQRYQSNQTGWDRGQASPALQYWLDKGVLAPGNVLIPGCGLGHEVLMLSRLGFNVTAIDIATTAVECLKLKLEEENVSAEVIQTDLLQWQAGQAFDLIYEQTCLCALAPEQWKDYEEQLHRWLKSGGKVFALFMQTWQSGGPPYHCDIAAMRQLFPDSRWRWNSRSGKGIPHPSGREELAFILEKI